jgi:hypothetical protein
MLLVVRQGTLTHDMLDELVVSSFDHRIVAVFRAAFVRLDLLPERDEYMIRLAASGAARIRNSQLLTDRIIAERFLQWWVLRRARQRSDTSRMSDIHRRHLQTCLALLTWLQAQGTRLGNCQQSQLDEWLKNHRSRAHHAQAFVHWAVRNHLAHDLTIHGSQAQLPMSTVDLGQQQEIVAALLRNADAPVSDRLAGLLVALYAQLFARIARMPLTAVIVGDDGTVQLRLGREPVLLPPGVGELAAAQHEAAKCVRSPWLFPSAQDRICHIGVGQIRRRLQRLGISGKVRDAALIDLARELPAPVLRDAIGIHGNTAARWTFAAGGSWAGYVALHEPPRGRE